MKVKILNFRAMILILGIVFSSLVFNSCKKDATSGDGYVMRFYVDGSKVEFTGQGSLVAAFAQSGTIFNAVFTGYTANSNMGLQIFDNKAIGATTYSGYGIVGSSIVGVLISYEDTDGTVYTQGTGTTDATITISEITDTTVRGTFSGTLKANGKPDIKITNGEFFVWRAN